MRCCLFLVDWDNHGIMFAYFYYGTSIGVVPLISLRSSGHAWVCVAVWAIDEKNVLESGITFESERDIVCTLVRIRMAS